MDFPTPQDTITAQADQWRSQASLLRQDAAHKIAQAVELETNADLWDNAAQTVVTAQTLAQAAPPIAEPPQIVEPA